MSGKRLIDAAKLVSASGSIAKNHYRIRKEQYDLFTRTSSVAKAVKSQTDRVTLTVGAAIELAKRFNDNTPSWQKQAEDGVEYARQQGQAAAKEAENVAKDMRTAAANAGLASSPLQDADVVHDKAQDIDGTLESLRKRQQQRQSEAQIPQESADAQPAAASRSGHDTFNERPEVVTPELSSLPRTKLPRHVNDAHDPEIDLRQKDLNQDVFPAPTEAKEASPESLPEGADQIFHSPRISKMLGASAGGKTNPYAKRQKLPPKPLPEMVEAARRREEERAAKEQTTAANLESEPARQSVVADPEPVKGDHTEDKETQALAAEIAESAKLQESNVQQDVSGSQEQARPYEMRESRVPATRFGRIWQYGGLATSMAFGAVGESFSRLIGGGSTGSLMLSEGNMNRLVAKLSRMRGAALKLGQMMSFQDSKILPPTINSVLQRVQDSADYMPSSQRDKVLSRNLGSDWRDKFSSFQDKPFAAASIGQVHRATLKTDEGDVEVAVKVQYPGVRNSIDSDLNNLSLLLTASQLLPKGLFLDRTIANARTELGWECDYEREAKACIKFRDELLIDETDTFTVPKIYTEASGPDVLTAEFLHGTGVTKIKDMTQQERDWIGTNILRLCLRELMEFKFMQTDPNWTNFLYNRNTKKLELLDFGASREFPDKFVKPYCELLIAASKDDREACRDLSIELGYLTGHESPAMLKAHVDSILTLAEPFVDSAPKVYDFKGQTVTDRVRQNIGLMLRERMAPPPEETYSLHRKLSGAFLLCARLESKVHARDMFAQAARVWRGQAEKVKMG
ncbi:putative ABC1 atypical kinase-like domain, protein kinase-like domain superfamily [Septoria linicola]|nr:putative ABC1 atypical kinase-like domain, protein kinase-like domain superfamily [Septoria linicola]